MIFWTGSILATTRAQAWREAEAKAAEQQAARQEAAKAPSAQCTPDRSCHWTAAYSDQESSSDYWQSNYMGNV